MRASLRGGLFALCLTLPTPALAEAFFVLDAAGDRTLVATPLPAPANVTPSLRLRVSLRRGDAPLPSPLESEPVAFARLLPGEQALVVTTERTLYAVDLRTGSRAWVDRDVQGAVATSPDGRHWAYCRSPDATAPDGDVFRADAGVVRQVTTGFAPTWSPAISPDGRIVAFVSARTGVPAIWLVEGAREPRQITNVGVEPALGTKRALQPFPDAMTPPLLADGKLVFESGGDVHVIDMDGRPVRRITGAMSPAWDVPGKMLRFHRGAPPRAETTSLIESTARKPGGGK